MARVNRTRLANEDLISIWSYIAHEKSPDAADHVLQELDATARFLADNPETGQLVEQYRGGLRMFSKWKYLIFYQRSADGIEVYRVLHGARAWQDLI